MNPELMLAKFEKALISLPDPGKATNDVLRDMPLLMSIFERHPAVLRRVKRVVKYTLAKPLPNWCQGRVHLLLVMPGIQKVLEKYPKVLAECEAAVTEAFRKRLEENAAQPEQLEKKRARDEETAMWHQMQDERFGHH